MFERIKSFFSGVRNINQTNPSAGVFLDAAAKQENQIAEHSVISKIYDEKSRAAGMESIGIYNKLINSEVSFDKVNRLAFYRTMSTYPEVSDAIDEIVDAAINLDDEGKMARLNNFDPNFSDEQRENIENEFRKYFAMFDFENNGYDIIRSFIIDGEVSWENIIDKDHTDQGIIGVNRLQPECYEYLVVDNYNIAGFIFNAKLASSPNQASGAPESWRNSTSGRNYNVIENVDYYKRGNKEPLVMPLNQITHINTGVYNSNKTIVYPLLEKARRSYRQLTLLEDAVIIYILVRAPERYLFNVDTGKLNAARAEQMVMQMMQRFKNKKVYDPQSGTVVNDYDPQQMLESYWFAKPAGSNGTEVKTVGGSSGNTMLNNLEFLQYFHKKLYTSLKVPFARSKDPTVNVNNSNTINYEEFRFSKFVMRIMSRFALGLKDSFMTHLRLTGLYEQYDLNDGSFNIQFTPPSNYDLYISQQILKIKFDNYSLVKDHEELSKSLFMKKFLKYTDKEVEENFAEIEREEIRKAMTKRKVANVEKNGFPDDKLE